MYKTYLKQAWQMLKEDKVVSIISIFGTALAITIVMVIILTKDIKLANLAPEVNRDRMLYISHTMEEGLGGNKYTSIGSVSLKFYKQFLGMLKTPESISMISSKSVDIYAWGSDDYIQTYMKRTDSDFWNIFRFSFIEGRHFSNEEFQSGVAVAVISKNLAHQLFRGETAMGKTFSMYKKEYKVIGIVDDVSTICQDAYSQIWVPYTSCLPPNHDDMTGTVVLLAKTQEDFKKIKAEVRQSEIHNNAEKEKVSIKFYGPFDRKALLLKAGVSNVGFSDEPDTMKDAWKFYLSLSILLLIPAINLSGFSLFRIVNRTSEIGIRKAFGATKKTILVQVLYENMLTSILGGLIGLVLSVISIILIKDRLFGTAHEYLMGENTIPVSVFFSPLVFFSVFLVCFMLNLLSSGISAWRASRLNIVTAIKA